MNELVKIESRGEKQVISAKELYEKLEMDKSHWKRWAKNNIETNDFFLENIDYEGFATEANGNETLCGARESRRQQCSTKIKEVAE